MSNVKAFVLMAGLTALFVPIGGALGGQGGMCDSAPPPGIRGEQEPSTQAAADREEKGDLP